MTSVASSAASFPGESNDGGAALPGNWAAKASDSSDNASTRTSGGPSAIARQMAASHIQSGSLRETCGLSSTRRRTPSLTVHELLPWNWKAARDQTPPAWAGSHPTPSFPTRGTCARGPHVPRYAPGGYVPVGPGAPGNARRAGQRCASVESTLHWSAPSPNEIACSTHSCHRRRHQPQLSRRAFHRGWSQMWPRNSTTRWAPR